MNLSGIDQCWLALGACVYVLVSILLGSIVRKAIDDHENIWYGPFLLCSFVFAPGDLTYWLLCQLKKIAVWLAKKGRFYSWQLAIAVKRAAIKHAEQAKKKEKEERERINKMMLEVTDLESKSST